jgi:outer membrane receptor protein involved in Fe transport
LNPSAGFAFVPARAVRAYASYGEGSRAPTSVELGCADPDQPCRLPNAMAGDPPLRQVVARTFEAGLRGSVEGQVSWGASWFRGENRDDILFVSSSQSGFGYFKNFGRTRRQGFEASLNGTLWRANFGGNYTFLDATYRSPETVGGSSNSANDGAAAGAKGMEGTIEIRPGNRIPLIPRQMFKAFADIQATRRFSLNLSVLAVSSTYARGNENNRHQPDREYYLGPGSSPGYATANLGGRYRMHARVELVASVSNLLNRHYYTAAQLGPTGFTDGGAFIARPFPAQDGEFPLHHAVFYAPGAPRAASGGIRFKF